jgi:FdhD protein
MTPAILRNSPTPLLPTMTQAGLKPTYAVTAYDERGLAREVNIAGETPLTLFVDGRELVTLMTLGTFPEALAIGYLRNQRFIERLDELVAVTVDWTRERVDVKTARGIENWEARLQHRTVTTGCGQGTVFSCSINKTYEIHLPALTLTQSYLYHLLALLAEHNEVYRQAGAVHGCALCRAGEILAFVEDVGRHNAADAIAGLMWLHQWSGEDMVFYTTGRLTSEIVMKTAYMGIPVLLSRSGVTQMGLELAAEIGVTMIARAKGQHFLIYNGVKNIIFDASPV